MTSVPADYAERELHNMFAFATGFVMMQTYHSSGGTGCFALFDTNENAILAMNHLQGYVFDQTINHTLKVQMARRNLKPATSGGPAYSAGGSGAQGAQQPAVPQYQQQYAFAQPQMAMAAMPQMDLSQGLQAGLPPPGMQAGFLPAQDMYAMGYQQPVAAYTAPQPARSSAPGGPCDTLCLRDHPWSSEADLLNFMQQSCRGVVGTKMHTSASGTSMAWVQFSDVETAGAAMQTLTMSGMRAEYSKNPLNQPSHGRKQDFAAAGSSFGSSSYRPSGGGGGGGGGGNPCDTLCLRQHPFTSETEMLTWANENYPNMAAHKWHSTATGQQMVWIQFSTQEAAAGALQLLSCTPGIRAEYSKNPLNNKRKF